jgi:hypothetical protein
MLPAWQATEPAAVGPGNFRRFALDLTAYSPDDAHVLPPGFSFRNHTMTTHAKWTILLGAALAGLAALAATRADEPAKADGEPLVVVDNGGKEHKLKTWKFTQGTRRLGWLAPAAKDDEPKDKPDPTAKAPPKGKAPAGPEALEFREEKSTNRVQGILTLVPLDHLRALEYDNMKETVKLTAATGPKAEDTATLNGLTSFQGVNKLAIEAEVDKGDLGVAEVKFLGGVPKGVTALKFPAGKVEALPEGRPATVTTKPDTKGKTTHKVGDLQPLYRTAGGETLSPLVFFKKTLKIDVAKITKIGVTDAGNDSVWALTLKDGGEESLTLLTNVTLDGKPATLEGFVGRVPAGYKLFPVAVIEEVVFDEK